MPIYEIRMDAQGLTGGDFARLQLIAEHVAAEYMIDRPTDIRPGIACA
jgi:hypothetical protein